MSNKNENTPPKADAPTAQNGLPKGWTKTKIRDVCVQVVGGGTPSREKPEFFGGKIIWLTPTEIPKNCIAVLRDSREKITQAGLDNSSARMIPTESVLLTSRASIGYIAIAGTDVATNQGFASFICSQALHNFYLGYWLWSIRHKLQSEATGTTFKEISKAKLREFDLPLPPLPEQHRIVTKIEELFTKLDAGVKALKEIQQQLKRYRQSVLKAAFEGKLTEEWRTMQKEKGKRQKGETAAELLERIREERRKRYIEKRKEQLREYVQLRIAASAVYDRPEEALQDFVLEMVIDDRDISHPKLIDSIVAVFLQTIPGTYNPDDEVINYIRWLRDSVEAMKNEGVRSGILETQLEVWKTYVQEGLMHVGTRDHLDPMFNPQRPGMRPLLKQMATNWVLEQGCSYAREKFLEQPAWKEWEKAEAKRKRSKLDTSQSPKLPEGWVWARLGECTELITKGESPNWQGFDYVEDGVPFIRSENVLWGDVRVDDCVKIPSKFHQKLGRSQLKPNDVLLNLVGASIGRVGIVPDSLWQANINQAVALIRTVDGLLPKYLMQFILSPQLQKHIHGTKVETARANISLGDIGEFIIPCCSVAEQHQIVSEIERCFSVADAIEKTVEQGLAQGDRLRQSILKRAFEGKLVPQDPSDPPASMLLEQIKKQKESSALQGAKGKRRTTSAGK